MRKTRKSTVPKERGQPTLYRPEYCQTVANLCAMGATDVEIAEELGVVVRTIYRWRFAHPEFSQCFKAGKDVADERVIRAMYHKSIGYSHPAVKIFLPPGAKEAVIVPYTEHHPPDTTAGAFWLKNRRKDEWKDKVVNEVSGVDGEPIAVAQTFDFSNLSQEAREILRQALKGG